MKKCLLLLLIAFANVNAFSQTPNWVTLGAGAQSQVNTYCQYGTDLYVGGWFTNVNSSIPVAYIAKWNGTTWSALPTGLDGEVEDMVVFAGDLYVVGRFTYAGTLTVNSVAKWNGTTWSALGTGITNLTSLATVKDIEVYNGALYVGGSFFTAGGVSVNNMAKWDGTNWSDLGTSSGIAGTVFDLEVYNSELYVGGFFSNAANLPGTKDLAKWNGTNWSALGTGVNNYVYSLKVHNNDLYVGGIFTVANGVPVSNIAKWDGTNFSTLGIGTSNQVLSMTSYSGSLIVGGQFTSAGSVACNDVAKWDGTNWSALGSGLTGSVFELAVYNSELYAGGQFSNPTSTITANTNAAKWGATAASVNELSLSQNFSIYPNPTNGLLTISGAEGTINIYNVLGEQMLSSFKSGDHTPGDVNVEVDLSSLPNGIYFIRIGSLTKKIIKQ